MVENFIIVFKLVDGKQNSHKTIGLKVFLKTFYI